MSDILLGAADRAPAVERVRRPGSLVGQLAAIQARRLLRHPVLLVGAAWFTLGIGFGVPDTPYEVYTAVTGMAVFLCGPLAFFAANLIASSERRSGVDEWTGALPMPAAHRTLALLAACLAPAAVALGLSLGVLAIVGTAPLDAMPLVWQHVASVPVAVLGAGLLGVAVARLLPWPGMAMLVMVALVALHFWVNERWTKPYLGFYVDFALWTSGDSIPAMAPGDPSWHLIYLAAMTALAGCGALLRDVRRPWVPVLAGGTCAVLALVAGLLQLP